MDANSSRATTAPLGAPELTALGKRIELLRIERGISKQHLAKFAGTSRQQLWRVMTGKSEMSHALHARLADVLNVQGLHHRAGATAHRSTDEHDVSRTATRRTGTTREATRRETTTATNGSTLAVYLANPSRIASTLATLPPGDDGRALKRRLLDAIEDVAIDAGLELDHAVFELRRKVLSGQL